MDPFEKSTTVDPEVRAYISSLVNAVGGSSTYDSTYAVGDDAIAVLKDLQRWLRLYDEKTNRLDVKRCLAEANLVKNDLLEILALWPDDANENKHKARLALACFELLVPLTWPVVLDEEKATVNHHRHLPYLQLAQVGYKRAILHYEDAKILRTAVRIALPSMAQPRRERSRRDEGVIKLVLYLVRNIAMITQPQHLPSQGDENEVSRSATIEAFVTQDIFSALLTIGSGMGDEFQEQDVIVLEILFHLLKGVDARRLFMQKEQVTTEETQELKMLLQKEKAMLNSYNKHAPSRHHRFGTMLWVKRDDQKMSTVSGQMSITDEQTTLHQMDTSKKWNKPQYRGKLTKEFDETSDFGARIELTERAKRHLRQFVEDFLDSSFNPLFACLRRAIESQANRILETTHTKQYFYLMAWFLDAEAARREQAKISNLESGEREDHASSEDNTYAHIAAVLDQETFVLINRNMQKAFDDKLWQDLHATLLCFTQVLLTVQSMAESKDEEDQEIAENIQNRIFYEQSTHDRIVQVLRGYTHQGFAYLDAVTECVHVFVRMLERYSKQNVDLQVRQKRRSRKKQKQQNNENGAEDADEVADDMHEAQNTVSERKFDFARFSAKFLSQPCVDTFLSLIQFYRDLTPAQLKRAHRFFYRLAFKHELTVLLYRVDILQLFHKLIKGPEGLDPAVDGFRDWEQLIQQVFRRCIKWMEREQAGDGWKEAAVVEMLFSKVPGTVHYLQTGYERIVEKRPPRPPAELEVKPSVAEHQRIKVAATMMINLFKAHALDWTKKQIQDAIDERQAWEEGDAARKGPIVDQNEDGAVGEPDPPPAFFIIPDNDERKSDLFKDKHLRLLFTTLGFQRLGMPEDVDAAWIIPPEITVSKLKEALEQIAATELNPLEDEEGRRVADCVRSKTSARRNATFSESASDSEDASGNGGVLDETLFPPNLPEKRRKRDADGADEQRPRKRVRRPEKTQEELEAQQKAKAVRDAEKNAKIKSKLFITDSDDESDEERDQAFFRLEEERRRKQEGNIRSALLKRLEESDDEDDSGKEGKGSKSKRGGGMAAKQAVQSNVSASREDEEVGDTDGMRDTSPIELSDHNPSLSELSGDDSDEPDHADVDEGGAAEKHTPLTSPPPDAHSPTPRPLKELSVNRASARIVDSDDDDDVPLIKPAARRNMRAGFIIESDSE